MRSLRRRYWDWRARTWQRRMRTRRRKRLVAERIAWLAAELPAGSAVLDLGCGTGSYTKALAGKGYLVTGLDFSRDMLARARDDVKSRRASFRQADFNARLPLPDVAFDAALSVLSFDHVTDPRATLSELRRVLRPGGLLLLVTLSRTPARRGRARRPVHSLRRWLTQRAARTLVRTYSREEIVQAAGCAGFVVIDERTSDRALLQILFRRGGPRE